MWFDEQKGLCWAYLALADAMTKAPLGGEAMGLNPTERAKGGAKHSLLVEGNGVPVGLFVGWGWCS